MFKKSKEISLDLEKISESQKKVKIELDNILSNIPNIPHPDVPNGKDENDNIEISKSILKVSKNKIEKSFSKFVFSGSFVPPTNTTGQSCLINFEINSWKYFNGQRFSGYEADAPMAIYFFCRRLFLLRKFFICMTVF